MEEGEKSMTRAQQRLSFILLALGCLGVAAGISLYALRGNVSYYYTPTEIHKMRAQKDKRVDPGAELRVGGLVRKGTYTKNELSHYFAVTDLKADIRIEYTGILPDLFREGQGIVAHGSFDDRKIFYAISLVAKHDEKYTPPEMKKTLSKEYYQGYDAMEKAEEDAQKAVRP